MSMHIDGKKITEMYWGGRKIREAWYGGERVFSGSKPVEVMPPISGSNWDARDWLRSKLKEYGENYQTVTEIPFEIDTGEATSMRGMFALCSSLTVVPEMDTSRVDNMAYMFSTCESLTTVPPMDTRNVTNMAYMFRNARNITYIPDLSTGGVRSLGYMFYGCARLTDGNVRLIGKRSFAAVGGMIERSGLTREPFYNSSGRPI